MPRFSEDSKRKWSQSKSLQIALQGYQQAFPGETLEQSYDRYLKTQAFADRVVGFDRSSEESFQDSLKSQSQQAGGYEEEISVEDIPF